MIHSCGVHIPRCIYRRLLNVTSISLRALSMDRITTFSKFWIFVFLVFQHVFKGQALTISYEGITPAPKIIDVIEMQSLDLRCSSDDISADYFWKSDVTGFVSSHGPNLYIQGLRAEQSGNYSCYTNFNKSSDVFVQVLYPPTKPEIDGPIRILRGEDVSLKCTSQAEPPPNYMWNVPKHDNEGKLAMGPVFHRRNVEHPLHLRCVVANTMVPTAGESKSVTSSTEYRVDVLEPPVIDHLLTDYWAQPGEALDIYCHVTMNPWGRIWWTRDRDNFTMEGQRLLVSPFTMDDIGTYTCHASNIMHPSNREPFRENNRMNTLIHVFEPGNRWKCYEFSFKEESQINTPGVFPPNTDPRQAVCEGRKMFRFTGGDITKAPGCGQCICCQPYKPNRSRHECPVLADDSKDCEDSSGLIATAVSGWVVALIVTVVSVSLWMRRNKRNRQKMVTEVPREMTAVNEVRPKEHFEAHHRSLPHPPVKRQQSEHIYLDVSDYSLQKSIRHKSFDNQAFSSAVDNNTDDYLKPTEVYSKPFEDLSKPTGDYLKSMEDYVKPNEDNLTTSQDYLKPTDDYLKPAVSRQASTPIDPGIPNYMELDQPLESEHEYDTSNEENITRSSAAF